MRNVFKIVMVSVLMLLIVTVTNISNAVDPTGTMKLEQVDSTTKYNIGDTVTVKLSLTSINGSTGINIAAGQLVYDENIFEYIAIDNLNSWGNPMYDVSTKKFIVDRLTDMPSGDVLQVRFKLKAIPSSNKTNFKIRDIDCSDAYNAIEMNGTNEVSIDLTIENASTGGGTVPDTNTIPGTNTIPDTNTVPGTNTTPDTNTVPGTNTTPDTNTVPGTNTMPDTNTVPGTNTTPNTNTATGANKVNGTNTTSNTNNNGKKENTQSTGKLPQTGGEAFGMIIAIIFVMSVAVVTFIKYRNLNIK